MDLLDRLRPRWRHSDPDVRAAAARDLGPEDRDAVETLARDPDVRVRRVAVKKLDDPAVLDAIARDDADPGVRETAAERARARRVTLACGDAPVAECEAAMALLTDERSLASIAGGARHEAVRAAALERLHGDRPLREVVRSAADPAIRLAALARIQDAAILRAIAMGEGPAEVTVAAVERIGDPDALRAIAEHRTASKAARQRARALLPAGADLHAVGHKEARARQQALCSLVEGLTAERDVMRAADRVREAEHEWQAIARDVPPRDDVAARFARAVAAIADDAGSLTRRQAAADHARMALEEGLAARRALCERVEALDGAGARHALDDARAEWHRLAPLADERVPDLARRFAEAGAACLDRYESWRGGATLVSGLEAVVVEAEGLAGTSPVPPAKAWQALERRWRGLPRPPEAADAVAKLDTRWTVAGERLERRRREEQARRGEAAQENLTRLQALHARVDEMVTAEGPLKPNTARRDLQALDAAVQDLGPLPPDERRAAWTERLSDARDRLLRRVRQEEETEDWRRWANVVAQEELIRRVEALLEANDLAEGTRQLGKLQTDWAAVATATPGKSQALWERFRSVRNELRKRCDVYMSENLEKKRALCVQVADVGDATSWNETTDLIKRAQAEWKAIGPVPGKHAQSLWQQFREPCDRFFSRRKEHFETVDAERKEHAGKKIALCERAEGLADSTDWDATTALMKQLQAEWKASGPLPRAQGEALWQRFRGACDRFFDRRNRREEIAREATLDRGRALCDVVEALAATLEGGEEPAGDGGGEPGKTVDETWGEWLRLDLGTSGHARAIDDRLRAACARVGVARPECLRGTRFDPDTTRKRREKLCAKLEEMAGASKEAPKAQSLQEMALALRDRLASNTIAGGSGGAKGRREDVAREVEKIAATWAHLGPAFDDAGRELEARYERARAAVAERAR